MHTFAEAHQQLRAFWPQNLARHAYTLDTMRQLMDFLGNPQDKLKIVHVAGTSGKTSTCYYAAALLQAAGKQVGLTVSPHVYQINERVQINLAPLPEAAFCRDLTTFLDLIKQSQLTPTYFEILAAFAYWQFARHNLEYAVVEVGLGGRLDASNVVTRPGKVCAITDVGMDHMNVLGATLDKIAWEKAGIIQLHNSVVCYEQADEVLRPIRMRTRQMQASLEVLDDDAAQTQLPELPLFQQRNMGLARAVVNRILRQNDEPELSDNMVAQAARTRVPGRMEAVHFRGRTIILDGAHNSQKLGALADSLRYQHPGQPIAAMVAMVSNRGFRLDDAAKTLAGFVDHIIVTSFAAGEDLPHGSEDPLELAVLLKRHGAKSVVIQPSCAAALATLHARPEPVLLATGSFYLFNDLRPLLKKVATPH